MPRGPFTVKVAYAALRRHVDAQGLERLVRAVGGHLSLVGYTPASGPFAVAIGIDAATLDLLASIAPDVRPHPN